MPVLVLDRDLAQMTRFAKHLPIQRIASMLVWFRRELDDTDLQTIRKTDGDWGRCVSSYLSMCPVQNLHSEHVPHICNSSHGRSVPDIQQCSCQYHLLLE